MKKVLPNQESVNLFRHLSQLRIAGTPKCTYVLARNRAALKPVADALAKLNSEGLDPQRLKTYQNAVDGLIKKFSTHAITNKPIVKEVSPGSYQRIVPEDMQADFVEAREALDKEYDDLHVADAARQKAVDRFLAETTEVEFRTLSLGDLPKEVMLTDMNMLEIFIVETGEKVLHLLH
uniref:Uncharacterized protein n=1 Tax=viral metagenome TaxID=1070528 RepID=A0A6H2A299_9ZZZZ